MKNDALVKAEGVSKKFCRTLKRSLWYGVQDVLGELRGHSGEQGDLRSGEFWAVQDISFELRRGECLGLIGPNGAGKSTLLKMLNGLIKPDRGRITMRGRVGALIELGAGFNPILTGRENLYVNGAVLGLSRKEIDHKLGAIFDFAELGDFIDMPVQNYSSGMKVRLGFAVAAQLDPDVMIIDEVLAVGDAGFVLKCLNWIDNALENKAVIFVSHSMPMVSRICSDIMHVDHGAQQYHGKDVGAGIAMYLEGFDFGKTQVTFCRDNKSELVEAHVVDHVGEGIPSVNRLGDLEIKFVFEVGKEVEAPVLSLFFMDKEQRPVATCLNADIFRDSRVETIGERNRYEVFLSLRRIQFSSGLYNVTFGLSEELDAKPLLRVRNALHFQVVSDRYVWQPFDLEGEWSAGGVGK